MSFKSDRISHEFQKEISAILPQLKDPRIHGMLSIVRVDVSNDLSYGKIYVSSYEGLESAKEAVKGLESASGFIKRELSNRLRMRKCPDLKFIADDSIETSSEIIKKMEGLK